MSARTASPARALITLAECPRGDPRSGGAKGAIRRGLSAHRFDGKVGQPLALRLLLLCLLSLLPAVGRWLSSRMEVEWL